MTDQEEKKNKTRAALLSALVHGVLLLAFLFAMAWRAPDPPLPEYGIELNFGLDNVGSGDIQPETEPVESDEVEPAAPEELPEETVEEVDDAPVEDTADPVEEVVEEATDNVQESPDVVKKEVVEKKPDPVPQPVKETPKETKEQPKKVEEQPKTDPADGAKGTEGESDKQAEVNQGDNTNKTGDKGDEQGSIDSRALYGKQGGGGGSALEMTGWTWDFKPRPNDTSSENGRIVFEIKIDDQGEILSVRTLERSVSPAVEKIYRAEVEKLTFSKTSDNSIVAPVSTGRITFVIKSK